jgi:hypothetical protein
MYNIISTIHIFAFCHHHHFVWLVATTSRRLCAWRRRKRRHCNRLVSNERFAFEKFAILVTMAAIRAILMRNSRAAPQTFVVSTNSEFPRKQRGSSLLCRRRLRLVAGRKNCNARLWRTYVAISVKPSCTQKSYKRDRVVERRAQERLQIATSRRRQRRVVAHLVAAIQRHNIAGQHAWPHAADDHARHERHVAAHHDLLIGGTHPRRRVVQTSSRARPRASRQTRRGASSVAARRCIDRPIRRVAGSRSCAPISIARTTQRRAAPGKLART